MAASNEGIRAFIAVRLEPQVEAEVKLLIVELRATHKHVSWTAPDRLHLTLRFLGEAVPPEMIEDLGPRLASVAAQSSSFKLCASGLGVFPNLREPRIIWIGMKGEPISTLAAQIESAVRGSGFGHEMRFFKPHLTIGRVRDPRRSAEVRELVAGARHHEFGCSLIESFAVYRSILEAQGASYRMLQEHRLGGAGRM